MKNHASLPTLALSAMFALATDCSALTPVEDNFNGPALDTTVWNLAKFANASLAQSNKRLNFRVGPTTDPEEDYAYLELRNSQPSYNENWQVVLDVTNTAGHRDDVGVGFWIYDTDLTSNVVFFEFYGNATKKSRTSVSASFLTGGVEIPEKFDLKPKLTSGRLMVTFSAKTKLLTFHFGKWVPKKSGKGNMLVWQRMGAFSPTGTGGDARSNWNMNDTTSRFGIRLEGYGTNQLVGPNEAFMDNFVLRAPK